MDSILKAVRRSPNVLKDPFGKSRHKKLPEGWGENNCAINDGMTFYLKHLGSTLVEELPQGESYGDGISSKAVDTIVSMAKAAGKKLKKVAVTVSPRGIKVVDLNTQEVNIEISIYRISFCTADRNHDKVFAFIARNTINETMECNAFLCAKTKIAQAVTLTVSQSFSVANDRYERLQARKKQKEKKSSVGKSAPEKDVQTVVIVNNPPSSISDSPSSNHSSEIEINCSPVVNNSQWQNFNDTDNSLDDDFSKLAADRSRPNVTRFHTDLIQSDIDESVRIYFNEDNCYEAFSRQKSVEDLLSL